MSVRAAADQFGYLAGAVVGGVLLDLWGFPGVGIGLGLLMLASTVVLVADTLPRANQLPDPRRFIRRVPRHPEDLRSRTACDGQAQPVI